MRTRRLLVLALALPISVLACSSDDDDGAPPAGPATAADASTVPPADDASVPPPPTDDDAGTDAAVAPRAWGASALLEQGATDVTASAVALSDNGDAVVVWIQPDGAGAGAIGSVWASRYAHATGTFSAPVLIETSAEDAYSPSVAVDANGNATAAWVQGNVWVNRLTAGAWGAAVELPTADSGTASSPRVAMNKTGAAVAVWGQKDSTRTNIWAARYGSSWGAPVRLESDDAAAERPVVALNPNGNGFALWRQGQDLYASHYASTGGWGGAVLVETSDAYGVQQDPRIAVDDFGGAVAVWAGTDDNVWVNRFLVGSGGWGTADLLAPGGFQAFPGVTVSAKGDRATTVYRSGGDILARRFEAGAFVAAEPVEDAAALTRFPAVTGDDLGDAFAIWGETTAVGQPWAVRVRRYEVGAGWQPAETLQDGSAGDASGLNIVANGPGDAVAVWLSKVGGKTDLRAAVYR